MRKIKFLEIDEVLAIHEEMIKKFGGRIPVHDFTMLHSAISRPRATFGGEDLYPTIFTKAAALIQSLILNHPFDDGNKRTAIASCALLLERNGWRLELPRKRSIQFTLDIDAKRISFAEIAEWLEKHSKRITHRSSSA